MLYNIFPHVPTFTTKHDYYLTGVRTRGLERYVYLCNPTTAHYSLLLGTVDGQSVVIILMITVITLTQITLGELSRTLGVFFIVVLIKL